MTTQRLHCGVVNDSNRLFERATEIKSDPSFAEMFRFLHDFAIVNNRWKTDGNGGKLKVGRGLVKFLHEIVRGHVRAGIEFQFVLGGLH